MSLKLSFLQVLIFKRVNLIAFVMPLMFLVGCGGGGGGGDGASSKSINNPTPSSPVTIPTVAPIGGLTSEETALLLSQADDQLRSVTVKQVDDPLVQLGMRLFFSKSLGGTKEVACATCHHPAVGGGDALPLSVGVGAVNQDLVGLGRKTPSGLPKVPRNAQTVFNMALWDKGLFWDSRVESIGKEVGANGSKSGILTFESFPSADPNAIDNLTAAQALAPVVGVDEMKGDITTLGTTPIEIRRHLAERIGNYGTGVDDLTPNRWLPLFQAAYKLQKPASTLITPRSIAFAIGEYQRSMNFVNNPWREFLQSNGSVNKLSNDQLKGAVLFFQDADQGGAGCVACHNGPLLSDENHHVVGYPSIGPGPATDGGDDFGREDVTRDSQDRYAFRTASLLNIELTQPYGHAGAYATLEEVIDHYRNPAQAVDSFFDKGGLCHLQAFAGLANCSTLYPNNRSNTEKALQKLQTLRTVGVSVFKPIALSSAQSRQLLAFLRALTDPCLLDSACFGKWIPSASNAPDSNQLNAVDRNGKTL